jgi:hypothetical protein
MTRILRCKQTNPKGKLRVSGPAPEIFKNCLSSWPAMQNWDLDHLRMRYGNAKVPLSNYKRRPSEPSRKKQKVLLKDYIDFLTHKGGKQNEIEEDSYVAGWHFAKDFPEIMDQFVLPECFQDNLLIEVNKNVINFDWVSLFIGHDKVESPLHTDSFGVSVWIANLQGMKIVRMVPPIKSDSVYNGLDLFDKNNLEKLTSERIPIFEGLIEKGDILFLPPGYWHQVRNKGFTLAVSFNYVSRQNMILFEQQLKAKLLKPYLELVKLKDKALVSRDSHNLISSMSYHQISEFIIREQAFINTMQTVVKRNEELISELRQKLRGINRDAACN